MDPKVRPQCELETTGAEVFVNLTTNPLAPSGGRIYLTKRLEMGYVCKNIRNFS
jgi:hypothetical protein